MNDPEVRTLVLVGLNDELRGQRFEIGPRTSIGRSISSDIFLPDPGICRHHCQVEFSGTEYCIYRTGRDATVLLNGQPVRQARLQEGDVLDVGRFRLRVVSGNRAADHAASTTPFHQGSILTEAISESTLGVVLTVRVTGDPQRETAAGLLEYRDKLFDQIPELAAREQGSVFTAGQLIQQVLWRPTDNQLSATWHTALRVALQIRQTAFLCARETSFGIGMGIAFGDTIPLALDRDEGVWGPAADQSLWLAFASPTSEVAFVREPVDADSSLVFSVGHPKYDAQILKGMRLLNEGRRSKLETAEIIHISRFGFHLQALLLRAIYDPETEKITLTVLCQAPLEIEAEYVLATSSGKPLTLRCATSRQAPMRSVQAQFSCQASESILEQFLGWPTERGSGSIAHAA